MGVTDTLTDFGHPTGAKLGLYGAMPGFGGLVVLLFAPYIADYAGRRNGTAIGCLFILLGALIQAFPPASNPGPMYLVGRFFIGFGSNISNATCPLLITEIAHPRHRGKITTLYNTLWYLVRTMIIDQNEQSLTQLLVREQLLRHGLRTER